MDKKIPIISLRSGGTLLFSVGILAGILLYTLITWACFESIFYGFTRLSTDRLETLRCPLLMTTADASLVSADFANPTDKATQLLVRADISTPGMARRQQEILALLPGETKQMEWPVDASNVDLGNFIFVKVYQYPSYISGTREATCGIFVLPLPAFSGSQVFGWILTFSLFSILAGLTLWQRQASRIDKRDIEISRAMTVLAVVVLIGMFFSFQGNWMGSLLTLVVAILLVGAILFFTLGQ
jgi:hypothetical protein